MIFTEVNEKDLPKIMKWRNEQVDILRQYKPLTSLNQSDWFKTISFDKNQQVYAIKDKSLNLIGYCALVYINWKDKHAEISMIFDNLYPYYRRDPMKYYAEAMSILINIAFNELNLNKVYVEFYDSRKKDYEKMIQSLQFTKEGELRQHHFCKGKYENSSIYSLLREEYEKEGKKQ